MRGLELWLRAWRALNPARRKWMPLRVWWWLKPPIRVYVHTNASLDLSGFQFYNNDGTESTATSVAAEDTNATLDVDTVYHVRTQIDDTASGGENNVNFQLQYNLNAAGWNDVNGTSAVVQSAASQLVEGEDTTARLTAPSGGSFITPNAGQDEVDGVTGGPDIDFVDGTHDYVETVYSFQILSGDVADADTIDMRVVRGDATVLESYTFTPRVTVSEAAGAQTIAVGTASETEAAQTVTPAPGPVTITVGTVTETEASQPVAASPGTATVAVGATSESESAQPVAASPGPVTITVGTVVETETAQVVTPVAEGGSQSVPVGTVTESETVQPVGVTSTVTVTVGTATETEAAQTVSPSPGGVTIAVGTVTETEIAQALGVDNGEEEEEASYHVGNLMQIWQFLASEEG